jgi:predicted signal transduction protein with EAL and GGDEF domain
MYDITGPEEMAISARKILSVFNDPFMISGHELHVSTSIGISIYPDDGKDTDDLLKHADMAMYHSKESGRNTFQFYEPAINVRALERASLEYHLRRSIDQGELLVYYQPLVDIATRRVTCVEALIRWQHPTLGLLNPAEFLPLAEESGLILSIDSWILRAACEQNKLWQQAGFSPICVSVNLSARQFKQPDFADKVSEVLRETGLSARYLDLEITENTVMRDIEMNITNLARLTDMGVSFAIDDFGTGYTSLGWLRKLPIEKLKIDKSFMNDIEEANGNRAIINAIIALAHNLKLKVVAEGVETEKDVSFLRSGGCDEMQGYVFSKAVPAKEITTFISQ